MRVLTQLIIKYVMVGVITALVLPAVAAVTLGQALWAALFLTLIAYVLVDMGVLRHAGSPAAVVADLAVATLVFWGLPLVMPVATGIGPALVTGGAVTVGEILFHVYLNSSRPNPAGG